MVQLLSWDDTKKAVIVSGNLSDKCYVYFDLARFDETCDGSTLACRIAKQYTGTHVRIHYTIMIVH